MKKSELRNIIRESIKRIMSEQWVDNQCSQMFSANPTASNYHIDCEKCPNPATQWTGPACQCCDGHVTQGGDVECYDSSYVGKLECFYCKGNQTQFQSVKEQISTSTQPDCLQIGNQSTWNDAITGGWNMYINKSNCIANETNCAEPTPEPTEKCKCCRMDANGNGTVLTTMGPYYATGAPIMAFIGGCDIHAQQGSHVYGPGAWGHPVECVPINSNFTIEGCPNNTFPHDIHSKL